MRAPPGRGNAGGWMAIAFVSAVAVAVCLGGYQYANSQARLLSELRTELQGLRRSLQEARSQQAAPQAVFPADFSPVAEKERAARVQLLQDLKSELQSLRQARSQHISQITPVQTAPVQTAAPSVSTPAKRDTEPQAAPKGPASVSINLLRLLGPYAYYKGYNTHECFPPLRTVWGDAAVSDTTLEQLADKMARELADAAARILGKSQVSHTSSWFEEVRLPDQTNTDALDLIASDPRTAQWRREMSRVYVKYVTTLSKESPVRCDRKTLERSLSELGTDPCPGLSTDSVIQQMGYPLLPLEPIHALATLALKEGLCTVSPEYEVSYGHWLEQRFYDTSVRTYNVASPEEDAVLFLFDLLYENRLAFRTQYWMGAIAMQNPFDMMTICEIIHTVRPDLIIETGTANGGSALLWASMLELNGITEGRVLTVDINAPAWDPHEYNWGGDPRKNPTQNPLWDKYVTFIKGSSHSDDVYNTIREAAQRATSVFVILDGDHSDFNVRIEAEKYCPFTTVGSYCLIQDTKLSRFTTNGPLHAAKDYVTHYPHDFRAHRLIEPFYTQHAYGYLKRIGKKDALPPN